MEGIGGQKRALGVSTQASLWRRKVDSHCLRFLADWLKVSTCLILRIYILFIITLNLHECSFR